MTALLLLNIHLQSRITALLDQVMTFGGEHPVDNLLNVLVIVVLAVDGVELINKRIAFVFDVFGVGINSV